MPRLPRIKSTSVRATVQKVPKEIRTVPWPYLDLLYSNSMCKQSSMPTSILMLLLRSGYDESVCTAMSCSHTMSLSRRIIVTRTKYLSWTLPCAGGAGDTLHGGRAPRQHL